MKNFVLVLLTLGIVYIKADRFWPPLPSSVEWAGPNIDSIRRCKKWKAYCEADTVYGRTVRRLCPKTCGLDKKTNFETEILEDQNKCRKLHGVPALQWSEELAELAKKECVRQKAENVGHGWYHYRNGTYKYGENIDYGSGAWCRDPIDSAEEAVKNWYKMGKEYNYDDPDVSLRPPSDDRYRSFPQLLWKATTTVGCAYTRSLDRSRSFQIWICCQYDPKGNIEGEFIDNVPRPI